MENLEFYICGVVVVVVFKIELVCVIVNCGVFDGLWNVVKMKENYSFKICGVCKLLIVNSYYFKNMILWINYGLFKNNIYWMIYLEVVWILL